MILRAYAILAILVGVIILVSLAAYSVERWARRREKWDDEG